MRTCGYWYLEPGGFESWKKDLGIGMYLTSRLECMLRRCFLGARDGVGGGNGSVLDTGFSFATELSFLFGIQGVQIGSHLWLDQYRSFRVIS